MKLKRLPLVAALALVAAAPAALASDALEGTVLAFDRVARVLVMSDRSVVPLDNLQGEVPEDLVAGDRIAIGYESDEDGISVVHSIERID